MKDKEGKKILIDCTNQFSVLYFNCSPVVINLILKIPKELRKNIVLIDKFAYTDKLPSLNKYQKSKTSENLSGILLDPLFYFISSSEIIKYYETGILQVENDLYIDTKDKFHQAVACLIYGYSSNSLTRGEEFIKGNLRRNLDFGKYVAQISNQSKANRDFMLIGDSRSTAYWNNKVENLSINGCTYAAFANSEINFKNIDKLVIFLGINDLIYQYSLIELEKNIKNLFLKVRNNSCETLVITNYKLLYRAELDNKEVIILNKLIEKYAKNYGFYLYELTNLMDDEQVLQEQYSKDGIHLNEKGEKILFNVYNEFFH